MTNANPNAGRKRPPSPAEARILVATKCAALVNDGIAFVKVGEVEPEDEPKLIPTVQIAEGPAAPVNHFTLTFNRDPATGAYDCTLG